MFGKVKEDLFTIHGIITTMIHVCFIVGFITSFMIFQTEVMGNDPVSAMSSATNLSKRK